MIFLNPMWLALLLLVPVPWLLLRRKEYIGYSSVKILSNATGNGLLHKVPLFLFSAAFVLLVVCLARPQVHQDNATQVIKSRDIVIGVDISGSMGGLFQGQIPPPERGNSELDKELPVMPRPVADPEDPRGSSVGHRRIDAAQAAILRFVRNRYLQGQGDRIGILVFDTQPRWSWPLTDDLKMIYRKGLFISEGLGGGTNFGSIEPGPIDAASEHFDERGQAASKVLILVTDGEDGISYTAWQRMKSEITSRGVHFYVIGVGETLSQRNVDITQFAEEVGGQVFRVENAADMTKCIDAIDQMERSPVQVAVQSGYRDIFGYFAFAALAAFFLGVLSELVIIRQ